MTVWAFIQNWSAGIVMWLYWSQSVSIGILWFLKIISLRENSWKDGEVDSEEFCLKKSKAALSFLIAYGAFHFGYFQGLQSVFPSIKFMDVLPMASVFCLCHGFSFCYNKKWDFKLKPKTSIGDFMSFPFMRIVPMHLTFMLGGALIHVTKGTFPARTVLVIFMLLKIFPDVYMHALERKGLIE